MVEAELDTASFQRSSNQVLKYARDTKKALDPELYLKLELDVAKLQSQLANARGILAQAKKAGDQDLIIKTQIDTNRLQVWLTEAKRQLNNFVNTWDKDLSRLQMKFNQMANEAEKTRETIRNLWLSWKDLDKINKKVDEAKRSFDSGKTSAQEYKNEIEKIGKEAQKLSWQKWQLQSFAEVFAGAWILAWVQSLSNWVITLAWNLQQARIAFGTMIWSASESEVLLKNLSEFAKKTPFELTGLREQAKLLLAYWFEANEIVWVLENLWNISAWVWVDKLPRLTYALWQVRAAWKLTWQDFRQFTETWVSLWEELSKITGIANINSWNVAQLWITYAQVQQALQNLSAEGGKFWWLMEAQSQTLQWSFSNLKDNLNILGEEIWSLFIPALTSIVKWVNSIVQIFSDLAKSSPVFAGAIWFVSTAIWLLTVWMWGYLALAPFLTAANAALLASFSAFLWPIALVTAGIAWVSYALDTYNQKQEDARLANIAGWRSLIEIWNEIKEVERKLSDLNAMVANGTISQEEYQSQTEILTNKLQDLRNAQIFTTNSTEDLNKVLWVLNSMAIDTSEDRKQLLAMARDAEIATQKVLALARAKLEAFALVSKTWKAWLERKQTQEWKRALVGAGAVADNNFVFTDSLATIAKDTKELDSINREIAQAEKLLKDFEKVQQRVNQVAKTAPKTSPVSYSVPAVKKSSWWSKWSSATDTARAKAIKEEEDLAKKAKKAEEDRFKMIEEKGKKAFDWLNESIRKSGDEVNRLQDKLKWVEDQLAWIDESIANRILTIEEQLRTAQWDERVKLEQELALAKSSIDAETLQRSRDEALKSETQKLLDKKTKLQEEMVAIQEKIDYELQAQKDLANAKVKLEEMLTDKYKVELQKRESALEKSVNRQIALITSIPSIWWSASGNTSNVTNNSKNININANISSQNDAESLFRKISQ